MAHSSLLLFAMDSPLERMSTHGSSVHLILSELGSYEEGELSQSFDGIHPIQISDDDHRPVSPATPFESFFLSPHLQTNRISAFALSSQLRSSRSSRSQTSVATDEFGTAFETTDDFSAIDDNHSSLFGKDVLIISRQPIPEVSIESYEDTIMTSENQFDVAEHAYEGVKGVWAWGKGVGIIKPFLGIAEAVAGKVVGFAGTTLEDIDGQIKPKLADLDDGILNPSIAKVVEIILSTADKSGDKLRPIIEAILRPLGIIKIEDGEAETTPEVKTKVEPAPEVTTSAFTSSFGKVSMSLGMSK
jgi:hypothetical protein